MSADGPEAGEQLPGAFRGAFRSAKAAHATLALPGRLMTVPGAVVQPGSRFDKHVRHV
ncbi:hypothetical protein SAMN05192564_102288 [Paraburkholderia sartisoli]|uniref:Uncharacterized protein n=1 Tax=Paraburkholderia sartisoli TaxID=83784 RepID=A0A1H4CGB2_9BURK|nr:hypothetical protein SAMN05192564_102288 [Paraburkholderia sartisoli]